MASRNEKIKSKSPSSSKFPPSTQEYWETFYSNLSENLNSSSPKENFDRLQFEWFFKKISYFHF